ncbi:hypothetical protein [Bacteroides uniformis]|uniref:hypothetical protein n=1 Tax=Bacteroides uniformis TaxID=820 RepID=UPI001D06C96A|nr:hypothetical protein [Bacteroides uniformis]MCB6980511.1 hypothetical protein [Bacteroides uniformis]MCB7028320.1 hypothetical protein [Bacteroides uniformis]
MQTYTTTKDAAPVTNYAYGIVVAGAAFFVVAILGVLTAGRMAQCRSLDSRRDF